MHKSLAVTQKAASSLAEIFDARSVAVVGASADPGKAGYQVLKTLLTMGYQGQVFAVNPKEREILGVACHASILDIKSPLDLLVISLPAPHVLGAMKQAVQRGDSFTDFGNRPDLTPSHQLVLPSGITSKTCGNRMNPVSGMSCI